MPVSPHPALRATLPEVGEGEESSFRRPQLRAQTVDQLLRLGAFDAGDIVLVLEQHAERVRYRRGVERDRVEFGERACPVERLGNAGRLEQIMAAQRLDEMDDFLR